MTFITEDARRVLQLTQGCSLHVQPPQLGAKLVLMLLRPDISSRGTGNRAA